MACFPWFLILLLRPSSDLVFLELFWRCSHFSFFHGCLDWREKLTITCSLSEIQAGWQLLTLMVQCSASRSRRLAWLACCISEHKFAIMHHVSQDAWTWHVIIRKHACFAAGEEQGTGQFDLPRWVSMQTQSITCSEIYSEFDYRQEYNTMQRRAWQRTKGANTKMFSVSGVVGKRVPLCVTCTWDEGLDGFPSICVPKSQMIVVVVVQLATVIFYLPEKLKEQCWNQW